MASQHHIARESEGSEDQRTIDLAKGCEMPDAITEIFPSHNWNRPGLAIEIPTDLESSLRIDMPRTPGSASMKVSSSTTRSPISTDVVVSSGPSSVRGKSSVKHLLQRLSFKYRSTGAESENHDIQVSESPMQQISRSSVFRSLSFTKLFMGTVNRTSSLPVTPVAMPDNTLQGISAVDDTTSAKKGFQKNISRSLSVPVNIKSRSIRRMDSLGRGFRVIPSTPRVMDASASMSNITDNNDSDIGGDGEDIPEEEAVCRICMIELREGGDTIKLECSCKGELALAHQECAVKWFTIKGNKNCDVCNQEVQNLSVTLLRVQYFQASTTGSGNRSRQTTDRQLRMWLDMPVLVIVSMLFYFCFLEQLLVFDKGTAALAISLPFSCILGLLASMTSSAMVIGRFIWLYASFQFVLLVFFAHLFYNKIHMQAIVSIVLATFAGFGITMSVSSVIVEFLRWKIRRAHSNSRRNSRPNSSSPTVNPSSTALATHNV